MQHRGHLSVLILICLLPIISYAQVNIKSGYNFSVPSSEGLNLIIEERNRQAGYTDAFSKIQWMHGLEAGLRLKGGVHAVELSYQGAYQSLKAKRELANETYDDKIKTSIHAIALGYQAGEGLFGLGLDFQYQFHRIRFEDELGETSFQDVQSIGALKPYLMLTLSGSGNVDMAVQPYGVFPLKSFDYSALQNHLGTAVSSPSEKWIRLGVTVLFYNGG